LLPDVLPGGAAFAGCAISAPRPNPVLAARAVAAVAGSCGTTIKGTAAVVASSANAAARQRNERKDRGIAASSADLSVPG
jgi:hypothetical protein